ncbi:MAG: DNA-3-methyladenine glycosylase I [Candidatus Dormibacter sp.]
MTGRRCFGDGDPLMEHYHDEEWGYPTTDEQGLFELLTLEAFQSGLSWRTILARRPGFRTAFAGFQPETLEAFGARQVTRLLADASIIRNRAKIEATIANAQAVVRLRATGMSLWTLVRAHAPQSPLRAPANWADVPAKTTESDALARDLERCGFRFVGPTTAYALMQAAGVVNDHLTDCPARPAAERARRAAGMPTEPRPATV